MRIQASATGHIWGRGDQTRRNFVAPCAGYGGNSFARQGRAYRFQASDGVAAWLSGWPFGAGLQVTNRLFTWPRF